MICSKHDHSCPYHACMSDDCQMAQVHASGSDFGVGTCGKTKVPEFAIRVATSGFRCPLCNSLVKTGEVYYESEAGTRFCLCRLPGRKLIPVDVNGKKGMITRVTM